MTTNSPKSVSGGMGVPRSLRTIVASIGTLALFLVVASLILISHPTSSSLQGILLGADRFREPALELYKGNVANASYSPPEDGHQDIVIKKSSAGSEELNTSVACTTLCSDRTADRTVEKGTNDSSITHSKTDVKALGDSFSSSLHNDSGKISPGIPSDGSALSNTVSETEVKGIGGTSSSVLDDNSERTSSGISDDGSALSNTTLTLGPHPVIPSSESNKGSCDLYQGKWVHDPVGPLYTNNTCPIITQMQNCQGNGRPDQDYENWRWKPDHCDLPRFDARKFLELMRGKTLAFIGDSVARNHFESMLCILWQVEAPKNRGSRKMQRWYFGSTSTSIVRIWSSWLVHTTSESLQFAPEGVVKVHLDIPDEKFMEFLPRFDVMVLSSGHWFAKQSAYVLNGTIVGGQLWWRREAGKMQINNIEAFGVSVETILTTIASNPNFKGLAIVRSFSPDHYEGGAWNTGGSCTGKERPVSEVVRNGFTDVMHEKQVAGFRRAAEKVGDGSKLRLMDITEVFSYRPDGHPGPFRSPDPNKKTKRGPHGEPPPQDCLHWCMPGPVDTWNEMLMEIIRREFEGGSK